MVLVLCFIFSTLWLDIWLMFDGEMLTLCSLIAFNANVIQFGTDQLHMFHMHDASTDEYVLYIHFYMCGLSM